MKIKLTLLFVLLSTALFAQGENDKIVYMDSLRKEVPQGEHKLYKVIKDYNLGVSPFRITTYSKSGGILSEGIYNDKEGKVINGTMTLYYDNGNKKSSINYVENSLLGKAEYWYENEQLKEQGENIDAKTDYQRQYKLNQFWNAKNEHTVVNGTGVRIEENKNFSETAPYKNGYKHGTLTHKSSEPIRSYSEIYEHGNFISGETTNDDGTKKVYMEMERRPEPKKGLQHFYKYLGSNFKYSKEAIQNKISGKVIVKFVVDKDGKIIDVSIFKGLGYGLDEEAIRVVTSYENWIPGEQRGRAVRCQYMVPMVVTAQ